MNRLSKFRTALANKLEARADRRQGSVAYGLALLAGALLGGVALALLNRKTIQGLQHELENAPPPPSSDEIY